MLLIKYQLIGFLTIFLSISGCRSKSERTVELSDGSYSGKISKDGKKEGSGIYRWKDGSTYEGNYLEGKRHGHGKFLWANGESYKGNITMMSELDLGNTSGQMARDIPVNF